MASPVHLCEDVAICLLAWEVAASGGERYHVSFRTGPGAPLRPGRMGHVGGASWELTEEAPVEGAPLRVTAALGTPDEVFRLALGERRPPLATGEVRRAAPHWPEPLTARLARRRMAGAGIVAFDADWFCSHLATSAFDLPLLFPGGTVALGLAGLERASAILRERVPLERRALAAWLLRAAPEWDGEGRLVGELPGGELGQVGADIEDGCERVLGTGPRVVRFEPGEPLGLGLGPLVPSELEDGECVGMGLEVGEVDEGGAADRAGVEAGMVVDGLAEPEVVFRSQGVCCVSFEDALAEIDARRAAGETLVVTFDTAAPVSHLYAVEMPAAATLAALAQAAGLAIDFVQRDADPGAALDRASGGALVWREEVARLFIGEAGSLTSAHTDICPQVEIAHGLGGAKLLGVASHSATLRLRAEHSDDERPDEEATRVPTDRPLTPRQAALLGDPDVTMALLREGDLAVFHSGALHFASNGADGPAAALYHGAITRPTVPRLRLDAARAGPVRADDPYRDHLHAGDLLQVVEALLVERESL